MLVIKNISKTFKSDYGRDVAALDGLSLNINSGELVTLMGPNGSGKTTLFRVLDRQLTPDNGEITWNGVPIDQNNGKDRLRVVHVPQEPRALAFPEMSLAEHLLIVERSSQRARFWRRGITRSRYMTYTNLLKEYGLDELAFALSEPLKTLSVGWQQIFALFSTIAGQKLATTWNHMLILLDEPTSALDVENEDACLSMIKRMHSEGHTMMFATHDVDRAAQLAQRLVIINNGKLVRDISRADINSIDSDGVRDMIHVSVKMREFTSGPLKVDDGP